MILQDKLDTLDKQEFRLLGWLFRDLIATHKSGIVLRSLRKGAVQYRLERVKAKLKDKHKIVVEDLARKLILQ